MTGYVMRVELPPDLAALVKEQAKELKCPPWRVIERALARFVLEDHEQEETLPLR
jgi:predicted transcriptional regulator